MLRSLEGSCAQLPARPPNRLFLSAWTYGCFTLCFDTAPLYAVSKGRQLWLTRAFPAGPGALPQPHGAASSRPSFLSAPHDAPGSSHAPLSPVLAQPVLQAALPPLTGGCYRRGVWVRGTYRTSRSSHLLGLTLRPSVEVMPNVHTDWKLGDVRGDKYAQRHSPFAVSFRF